MPPEPQPKATATTGSPSWMAPVMPVVPDHELLRRIGGGSYGDVWLARTTVGTWRAVKVVFRDRFTDARPYEREFNGIQKFEPLSRGNEAFIDILQIGRNDAEGYFYYVMELADDAGAAGKSDQSSVASDQSAVISNQSGVPEARQPLNTEYCPLNTAFNPATYVPKTLSKVLLQRGRLPLGECLELGLTLNLGLAHLHRAGLIHRDIKPSNIIFVGGVSKLADIGLVVETAEARSYVGTEGFIPPEGPNSPQADLFSLGKVLYEAGMGKDRKDFPEPFTQIAEAPDSAQLLEFNAILLKACAANVKERYQSAEEMNADLALLQSGGSVRRQRKLAGQLRFVQRAGAVVTALAAVIALGWWWQARQTRVVRELANEKTQLADANARLAKEKETAAQQSHQRLVQMQTANGLRAVEENDPAIAALWFAEVLKLSEGDADAQRRQRDWLGLLFRNLPKPVAMHFSDNHRRYVWGTSDGRLIIEASPSVADGLGDCTVNTLEASSLRLLRSVTISNLWGSPLPSPSGRWAIVSEKERKRLWDLTTGGPVPVDVELKGTGGISTWSPDETRLALVKYEGTDVHLIEVPSGRLLLPPLHHSNVVESIVFDLSGRWLATGTRITRERTNSAVDDVVGQARVWNVHTGAPVTDWIEVEDQVDGLEFSPDGSALAIFSSQGVIRNSGQSINLVRVIGLPSAVRRFPPLTLGDAVVSVAFSPDGRYLATGCTDGTVTVWNAQTGEPVHQALKHGHVNCVLRFSPDGAWLAAGGEAGVRIWDIRSGALALPDLKHEARVSFFDFTPDGSRLITVSSVGVFRSYDLKSAQSGLPPMFMETEAAVVSATYSPDGKQIVTVSGGGDFRIWDAVSGLPTSALVAPAREFDPWAASMINRASWSPDGKLLVVPVGDKTARIWDVAPATERSVRLRHSAVINSAEFSPDGIRIVTASDDGTARIWDSQTGAELTPPLQHGGRIIRARFSPDGRRIATASFAGTARVWNAATGEPISPPIRHDGFVNNVRFSPDGSRLVVSGGQPSVTIRDASNGNQIGSTLQHNQTLHDAMFSRDGRRILTASADHTARVWDADTGKPVSPPLRHNDFVVGGDFSPDGLRVVTASMDKTARLWDATTGEALGPPFRHIQGVTSAAFSPDGRRVITSSFDGTAQLWEVSPPDWSNAEFLTAARMLAVARIGRSEQVEPLEPSQVEEAWKQVRSHFQTLAERDNESSVAWHRRRLDSSERSQEWFAAEFHGRHLVELLPGDAAAQADLERILAHRPPPRDPATPAELIDLSLFFNASLAVHWHPGSAGNHLGELPRGIQTLAGTRFDVRGLVQVIGRPYPFGTFQFPKEVQRIPINRKLARLQILHSIQGAQPPDGARVGHYLVHFANGRREEMPILYGQDLRDWHEHPNVPVGVSGAVIAWKGSNPANKLVGTLGIRLFKRTWDNPAPDVEVTTMDFVAEHASAHPFLIALTVE